MADQEVIFKLLVQQKDAAREVDQLADATDRVSKATADAENQYRRLNGTAKQAARAFDPVAEAHNVLARRDRQSAIDAEVAKLRPKSLTLGQGLGIAGAISAIGSLPLSAAIGTAGTVSTRDYAQSDAQVVSRFALELGKAIPIVGQFVEKLHASANLLANVERDIGGRFLGQLQRRIAAEAQVRQSGIDYQLGVQGLDREALNASGRAFAAQQVAAGLRAGGPFRPQAFLEGQYEIEAARTRAANEQGNLADLQQSINLPGRRAGAATAQSEFDAARINQERAERAYNGTIIGRDERIELERATNEAREKGAIALQKQKDVQQGINDLKAQENRLLEANKDAARAQLQLEQNRLGAAKNLARAVGGALPGEAEAALAAAEQAKRYGIQSLSPQQRALVDRFGGGEFLDRLETQRGQGRDITAQLGQAFGIETDIGKITGRANQANETFQSALAESRARYEEVTQKFAEGFASDMEKLLRDFRSSVIDQLRTELGIKRTEEIARHALGA